MKNKKLFAILTLVCFMMTLMPVAAFAADEVAFDVTQDLESGDVTMEIAPAAGKTVAIYKVVENENGIVNGTQLRVPATVVDGVATRVILAKDVVAGTYGIGEANKAPVAKVVITDDMAKIAAEKANAPTLGKDAQADKSAFTAVDGDQTVSLEKVNGNDEGVEFVLTAKDDARDAASFTGNTLYVWAEDSNGNVVSGMRVGSDFNDSNFNKNVYVYNNAAKDGQKFTFRFVSEGTYTVRAGVAKADATGFKDISNLKATAPNTIKVNGASVNPDNYRAALSQGSTSFGDKAVNDVLGTINVTPNNVMTDKYVVTFKYDENVKDGSFDGKTLAAGKTVAISTNSSSIEVNKESDVTDGLGQIDFKVSASVEGVYEVEVEVDGVAWTIEVVVGDTDAAYIELANQPKAPQALYGGLGEKVRFTITDINGNVVKAFDGGMDGIRYNKDGNADPKVTAGSYVVLTEKPAASNLESEDLGLKYVADKQQWALTGVDTMDAEGTYSVKVILDNGAYATATWEVKKFIKPVELRIDYNTTTVELGGVIAPAQIVYVDENGVEKQAKDATFAATGYAIQDLAGRTITVKTDEKYVGSKINVTAVSEKYDLVDAVELTVAEGAAEIAFTDKTAEVSVNNKIVWNVVDAAGNKVALKDSVVKTNVKYIVLDKPEGAKVSTYDVTNPSDLRTKGEGKLALTSNKIGNVTVQVVLKAEYANDKDTEKVQTKYYTGTQIFAVGNGSVGDVVVMSVGSNEIVINDAKSTIDAAPIVKNDRTFVPFRALAEAFGAEVAFDEATQAVTAELNGVKVVMTIGSATYTVNGAEKTMDVAPFINGSRTMVPVRFVAEAFGIKVIPTYDENGATADILFNL